MARDRKPKIDSKFTEKLIVKQETYQLPFLHKLKSVINLEEKKNCLFCVFCLLKILLND